MRHISGSGESGGLPGGLATVFWVVFLIALIGFIVFTTVVMQGNGHPEECAPVNRQIGLEIPSG